MISRKIQKFFLFAFVALLIVVACFFENTLKSNFIEAAKDSKAIEILTSYGEAEKAYFNTYHEFSGDEAKLGFAPKMYGIQSYFSKETLPAEYLKILPEDETPFVKSDSYRILISVEKKADKYVEFWTIDERQQPSKLNHVVDLTK